MNPAAPPLAPPPRSAHPPRSMAPGPVTARRFAAMHWEDDFSRELVRGEVVFAADWLAGRELSWEERMPGRRHGQVANEVSFLMTTFVRRHDLGRMFCNDTFVKIEERPDGRDTLRGADVDFYSYDRLPRDAEVPDDYLDLAPELVFEVRSPTDRVGRIRRKAAEYLAAGVLLVVWVEPRRERLRLFDAAGERELSGEEPFACPDVLPGFAVPAAAFFRR